MSNHTRAAVGSNCHAPGFGLGRTSVGTRAGPRGSEIRRAFPAIHESLLVSPTRLLAANCSYFCLTSCFFKQVMIISIASTPKSSEECPRRHCQVRESSTRLLGRHQLFSRLHCISCSCGRSRPVSSSVRDFDTPTASSGLCSKTDAFPAPDHPLSVQF